MADQGETGDICEGDDVLVAMVRHAEDDAPRCAGVFTSRRLCKIGVEQYVRDSLEHGSSAGPPVRADVYESSLNLHGIGPRVATFHALRPEGSRWESAGGQNW